MFELFLTICLQDRPELCADRLVPVAAETRELCEASAPAWTEAWRERFPSHAISAWYCNDGALAAALDVEEVVEGVFVHQGRIETPTPENVGDVANVGFVVGEEAVAVIDAGGSRSVGERLYAAIRRRTDLPIKWLILTHMHPDHVMGAGIFQEAGARIVGHPKLADALTNRHAIYMENYAALVGEKSFLGSYIVTPDRVAKDLREIDLGRRRLLLRDYRTAHTDNDLTVLDASTGTMFTGDLVFDGHVPALDGSILGWISVLQEMLGLEIKRIVPGHGPTLLDWPDGGEGTWNYLTTLAQEARQAIADGENMRSAIEHLGASMREEWELFDEYNPRNATAAYKELEWE